MSVELYEGCYGVTGRGVVHVVADGGVGLVGSRFGVEHDIGRLWHHLDGRINARFSERDITHVFPTREAAEAHLRGEPTPVGLFAALTDEQQRQALAFVGNPDFGPAEPQRATWPPGVTEMRFGAKSSVEIDCDLICINSTLHFTTEVARQLAALLVAAADCIERNAELATQHWRKHSPNCTPFLAPKICGPRRISMSRPVRMT